MNLFATVLTFPAPSANYGGETELNRLVIQKVTDGRLDYPIFSPESIRNALRETLKKFGEPCNRQRIHPVSGKGKSDEGEGDKQGLAVKFAEYPDPEKYIDDFFFGYLLAVKGKELTKLREKKGAEFPLKRDSVFRMNLAKALDAYRHNAIFNQSPEIKDSPWKPGSGDTKASSGLLHRETVVSGFQYPFALNIEDCTLLPPGIDGKRPVDKANKPRKHPHGTEWTRTLLKAIGELNGVAGKQARSYYEMAPASIIARLTDSLVAGYQTYCFKPEGKTPDVILDIIAGDFDRERDVEENGTKVKTLADEFFVGGEIVKRGLTEKQIEELKAKGVTLDRDPRRLLTKIANKALGLTTQLEETER